MTGSRPRWGAAAGAATLAATLLLGGALAAPARAQGAREPAGHHPPVFAYYYAWFDHSSWLRAKSDLPDLGPYSSDDAAVVRQHVRWAKQAGIEGFLVSWKHTATLDRRLALLATVAEAEGFKLGIVYQGLDFHRSPQPVARVARDLDYFGQRFAGRSAFATSLGSPIVIWSGTWRFSEPDIAAVTRSHRGRLRILASEKSVEGYQRLANAVDGDAYYWSSVNPETYPTYGTKLRALSDVVHEHHGLWIAPAAPGFDARLVGGSQVVPRHAGRTLSRELDAALASSPDAVGVISWNEFSENSAIEPSRGHGTVDLNTLAQRLTGLPVIAGNDRGTGRTVDRRDIAAAVRKTGGAAKPTAGGARRAPTSRFSFAGIGAVTLAAVLLAAGVTGALLRGRRRLPRSSPPGCPIEPPAPARRAAAAPGSASSSTPSPDPTVAARAMTRRERRLASDRARRSPWAGRSRAR